MRRFVFVPDKNMYSADYHQSKDTVLNTLIELGLCWDRPTPQAPQTLCITTLVSVSAESLMVSNQFYNVLVSITTPQIQGRGVSVVLPSHLQPLLTPMDPLVRQSMNTSFQFLSQPSPHVLARDQGLCLPCSALQTSSADSRSRAGNGFLPRLGPSDSLGA